MMAEALMKYETIESDQIDDIMQGQPRVHRRAGAKTIVAYHRRGRSATTILRPGLSVAR